MTVFHRLLLLSSGPAPVFGSFGTTVVELLLPEEVDADKHAAPVMVLSSSVTAPVCAKARPFKLAPVSRVMDVEARIFPMKEVPVPRVAELTSRHQTLQGSPPVTDESDDVVSVAADLKIQTPDPLRVRFSVSMKASAQ
jgi:hypothetical protein